MQILKKYLLHVAYLQALVATLGSLFFSEVIKLPPCSLCWYQRIFMYPLVIILWVGITKKMKGLHLIVIPMAILGLTFASYQNLLYYGILPESAATCVNGISCTTKTVEYFGFVSLPLLSLIAFLIIITCTVFHAKIENQK